MVNKSKSPSSTPINSEQPRLNKFALKTKYLPSVKHKRVDSEVESQSPITKRETQDLKPKSLSHKFCIKERCETIGQIVDQKNQKSAPQSKENKLNKDFVKWLADQGKQIKTSSEISDDISPLPILQ